MRLLCLCLALSLVACVADDDTVTGPDAGASLAPGPDARTADDIAPDCGRFVCEFPDGYNPPDAGTPSVRR